jgi:hypothetical protein
MLPLSSTSAVRHTVLGSWRLLETASDAVPYAPDRTDDPPVAAVGCDVTAAGINAHGHATPAAVIRQ